MSQPETIRPEENYYILATSSPTSERALVLKQGDSFSVFDHFGDIDAQVRNEEGMYHQGTRFLSRFELLMAGGRPLLLSSGARRDNLLIAVDLTNPDVYHAGEVVLPRGTVHVYRSKLLWEGVYYETIRIRNFGLAPYRLSLQIECAADFADIFEVRGQHREARGALFDPEVTERGLELAYRGLDGVLRRTVLEFSRPPDRITTSGAAYAVELVPGGESSIQVSANFEIGKNSATAPSYSDALARSDRTASELANSQCAITTSNDAFDAWLQRSQADLNMMLTQTPEGLYPYAGVPWFSTPFGRDGIITALESLWIAPNIGKGVLSYLAATQATESSAVQDAEPGKILHEKRDGEMAALGEVPFRKYYGSVDSTPLFLMLAAAYYDRTGDLEFIRSIWNSIELALWWVDQHGDRDGDGFVEYCRRNQKGLIQQGWKDSHDSVFHADGGLAEGPIALCEVQGYVFRAKMGAARLSEALGYKEQGERLRNEAEHLREEFEKRFWCDEIGMYAIALDGQKRQCQVRASNSGHCLYTGIASLERARRIAGELMGGDFYSGWGIRTVAQGESRYNPMSYHNGSVWPHDNALIAAGLARYDMQELTAQVFANFFELSTYLDLNRLPELFCGFDRRPGKGPTLYPVACSPQTWAAAAAFCFLQACIGLSIDGTEQRVIFRKPVLPDALEHLRLRNLRVNDAVVDVVMFRSHNAVALTVERREGRADVVLLN